jgi:hypothetical protein
VKTGVHPIPWIPFSNGMTDAERYLDEMEKSGFFDALWGGKR